MLAFIFIQIFFFNSFFIITSWFLLIIPFFNILNVYLVLVGCLNIIVWVTCILYILISKCTTIIETYILSGYVTVVYNGNYIKYCSF